MVNHFGLQEEMEVVLISAGKGLRLYFSDEFNYASIFSYDYSNHTPRNIILNSPGGNVGIGTTTPIDPLHVNGNLRLGTGTGKGTFTTMFADDQLFRFHYPRWRGGWEWYTAGPTGDVRLMKLSRINAIIAASVMSVNATLITRNLKDFQKVEGLFTSWPYEL